MFIGSAMFIRSVVPIIRWLPDRISISFSISIGLFLGFGFFLDKQPLTRSR
jgi:xanthine/uracil/vitamin C permease (AzgA family)